MTWGDVSDIRARRKPSDCRRERQIIHRWECSGSSLLGGPRRQVSLSLDSDREVLKLYIPLFDVNSEVNCAVAFHGGF